MADSPDSATEKDVNSTEIALPADLPPEVIELARDNPEVRRAVLITAEQYRGPIPHPNTLRGFEEVVPGSAKDLIEEYKQWGQLHRNLLEKQVNSEIAQDQANRTLAYRGQTIATSLVVLFGGFGIVRIFMGDLVGGGLLIAPALLGVLARVFLGNPEREIPEKSAPRENDAQPKT